MNKLPDTPANPVLAEFVRGTMVENRHRGAFCVVNGADEVVASAGDAEALIYPRSAIKSLQALALFRSGAVEKFNLDDQDLALACASHQGEDFHVQGVLRLLEKSGMSVDMLECGPHPPFNRDARKALQQSGSKPTALHNNCSGKHAGMLAVAKAMGVDPAGYIERDHAVQRMVRGCVERVLGVALTPDYCGRDGCSIPTWGASITSLARAFSRISAGSNHLSPTDICAGQQLFSAAAKKPEFIAGTGAFDTNAMTAFAGNLMVKVGAAGVYCGVIRESNLGFALKCEDGSTLAAETMVAALISKICNPTREQQSVLAKSTRLASTNWRGFEVGYMQPGAFRDGVIVRVKA